VLRAQQFRQLDALVRHAVKTVPFHRQRLGDLGLDGEAALTPEAWSLLPVLGRQEVQESFRELISRDVPKDHGKIGEAFTSGATATPVRVIKTALMQQFWYALTLRDHLWNGRDMGAKFAAIRPAKKGADYPDGQHQSSWGLSTDPVYETGPGAMLDISSKVHEQAEWLAREDPDYLLTYPSNLRALAVHCLESGTRPPRLKQVQTMSELLFPEVRELCREAFGVPVSDTYSSEEVGYIALQCGEGGSLHVQAEAALVEVLDDQGRPCAPGEVGQVVVTPLHNFAMPLLRYAVGDLAEVGGPCPCGRGLPVLARVLGRLRSMVRLPDGSRHYANFAGLMEGFGQIIQFQIVRRGEEELEVKLVVRRELDESEAATLIERIRERFRYPFSVAITYHDEIPRGAGGKFADYLSEVD
jgi:phenylacetate-CoA ligase